MSEKIRSEINQDSEAPQEMQTPEQQQLQQEAIDKQNRTVGAKILASANFHERHRGIVDSSFEKARKNKQKLVGEKNARRTDAYVTRIQEAGPKVEKRLWDMTAKSEDLLVQKENIQDSYWATQEEILRDNGRTAKLTEEEKDILVKEYRRQQSESAELWTDYFKSDECPYPTWFKLFAWDGVTKMSAVWDNEKNQFAKRDKTTVAPYPHMNENVLAMVYDAICKTNGLTDSKEPLKAEIEKIAKHSNFSELYSYYLSEIIGKQEVPERTEDVRGDWIEYLPGDEKKLASAATLTPWCVASPAVGKSYLETGAYGNKGGKNHHSKAKFILLHQYNEELGGLSPVACASIRLGLDGKVEEISGIKNGQVLHDSLVPIIEEKVKQLPGGEEFLEAFADKRELMRLDRKMRAGEELTVDELKFVYETDRPMHKLEQYGEDPRIIEIKEKYPLRYLFDHGIINKAYIKKQMQIEGIDDALFFADLGFSIESIARKGVRSSQNIEELLQRGVNHKTILKIIGEDYAIDNADYLIARGFSPKEISAILTPEKILCRLEDMEKNNIPYNLSRVVRKAYGSFTGRRMLVENYEQITERGGKVNFDILSVLMTKEYIMVYSDIFCKNGHKKTVEKAFKKAGKKTSSDGKTEYAIAISQSLDSIIKNDIKVDNLEEALNSSEIQTDIVQLRNIDGLIARGIKPIVNPDKVRFEYMRSNMARECIEAMARHPELFKLEEITKKMPPETQIEQIDILRANRIEVDVASIAKQLSVKDKIIYAKQLTENGVEFDKDELIRQLSIEDASVLLQEHIDELRQQSFDIRAIANMAQQRTTRKQDFHFRNAVRPTLWRLGLLQ